MPVKIDGKTFEDHNKAVEHLKKSKPEIKDPDAYVATVERSMKGAKAQRLYARLDNVIEAMSDYKSVIDSFKRGESAYGGNYHSDGSTLSLYGHPIAKHNGDKMSVSDAGYPTHTTHKALRHLGVDIKRKGGQTHVHGKPYKSGEFVDIPKSKLAQQVTDTHEPSTLKARLQKLAGEGMTFGGACPECTGKGKQYRDNCPTCEGTGKQMFPYSK